MNAPLCKSYIKKSFTQADPAADRCNSIVVNGGCLKEKKMAD